MLTRLLSVLIIIHALCMTSRAAIKTKQISSSSSLGKKILSLHNSARSKVRGGQYKNAKGQKQPKASSMPSIKYSSTLAASALKQAKKCKYSHSSLKGTGIGENLGASGKDDPEDADYLKMVQMWIDEGAAYHYNGKSKATCYNNKYKFSQYDKYISSCGHWEQAIWSTTTKMGCAYCSGGSSSSSSNVLVCQYEKARGLGTEGSGRPYKVKGSSSFMFSEDDTPGDTVKKVAILIAMILVVALIIGFIVYFVWKKKKQKGMQKIEEAVDLEEVNDESDEEIEVQVPMTTTIETES